MQETHLGCNKTTKWTNGCVMRADLRITHFGASYWLKSAIPFISFFSHKITIFDLIEIL
ncbi:hypothetical protein HanIR_Chr06g0265831 [Helianthus annuus]|nr:hypothetical protein HanIR_Chr06g0265831 [Helianthus annuus]